jgi:hypothetical protein
LSQENERFNLMQLRALRTQILEADWAPKFTDTAAWHAKHWRMISRLEAIENPARWLMALHESSHTVCAAESPQIDIVFATINGRGDIGGRLHYNQPPDRDRMQHMIQIAVGAMGENVWGETRCQLSGTDKQKLRQLIWELDPDATMDGFERSGLFRRILQLAREFVAQREPSIKFLATLLCRYGVLGGLDINKALSMEIIP